MSVSLVAATAIVFSIFMARHRQPEPQSDPIDEEVEREVVSLEELRRAGF